MKARPKKGENAKKKKEIPGSFCYFCLPPFFFFFLGLSFCLAFSLHFLIFLLFAGECSFNAWKICGFFLL
jgi:hypothetical protein